MTLNSVGDRWECNRIAGTWTQMQIEDDIVRIAGEIVKFVIEMGLEGEHFSLAVAETVLAGIGLAVHWTRLMSVLLGVQKRIKPKVKSKKNDFI